MLNISHLTKKYGDKVAVDDLSLEIKNGEIYGFIGHNWSARRRSLTSLTTRIFSITCPESSTSTSSPTSTV